MRYLLALLLTSSLASAETTFKPLPTFCDLIKERAYNLLTARFEPDFDLEGAREMAGDEPMFKMMLRHAWSIEPRENETQLQIIEFSEFWYAQCVLR